MAPREEDIIGRYSEAFSQHDLEGVSMRAQSMRSVGQSLGVELDGGTTVCRGTDSSSMKISTLIDVEPSPARRSRRGCDA
jgi:hypothetical protein